VVHAETCNSTAQHGEQPARACRLREGEAATVRRVKSTGGPLLGDRPPDYRCCIRGRHIGIASLAPTVRSGTGAARTAPSTVPASFGGGEAVRLPLVGSPNSTRRSHPCNTTAMHKSSMRTRRPGPSMCLYLALHRHHQYSPRKSTLMVFRHTNLCHRHSNVFGMDFRLLHVPRPAAILTAEAKS
jgi:hypothetical protein